MTTIIKNAVVVNEGRRQAATIIIERDLISDIIEPQHSTPEHADLCVDASGCFVLPGVIDTHVHFREPGLTAKADMESESRAAAWGGVTSFFDMPNTVPQTTTLEALEQKHGLAREKSHVNYSFLFGATNDNAPLLDRLDPGRVPAVKLFMGSSTGNMLVDRREVLDTIFARSPLPIVAHCEDTALINRNMSRMKELRGDDPPVELHPLIRSAEACLKSSTLAVELAKKHGARLHLAHVSTARELDLLEDAPGITAEAVIAHLLFTDADYARLGTRIKCNPSVKTAADRAALRRALTDGRIATVATDHAPHLLADKQGGAARAASGMPMVQFSLAAMLQLADQGVLTVERVVELMCHAPARLFRIRRRGFIRKGYKADLVVVRPSTPWTVTPSLIQSRCRWSPLEGMRFNWKVEQTFCNGQRIFNNGFFDDNSRGEPLAFG